MIKIFKIGTKVKVHNMENDFVITNAKIGHNDSIQYLVCGVNESGQYCEWWVIPNEITSTHKENTIISQCIS